MLDWGPNRGWEGQWAIFLNFDFWKCRTRDAFHITFSQDPRVPRGLNSKNQRMRHTRPSNSSKLAAGALVLPRTAATDMQKKWMNTWHNFSLREARATGQFALMCSHATIRLLKLDQKQRNFGYCQFVNARHPFGMSYHGLCHSTTMAFAEIVKTTYLFRFAGVLDIFGFEASCASLKKKRKQSKAGFAWMAQWASGLEVVNNEIQITAIHGSTNTKNRRASRNIWKLLRTKTSLILCCRYEHVNTVQL